MARTGTVVHDAGKIYELIEKQDLPPRPTRRGSGSGKKTAFAEKIGCAPGSIHNLQYQDWIGIKLARKIAAGLGVELADITLPANGGEREGEPEPAADAA